MPAFDPIDLPKRAEDPPPTPPPDDWIAVTVVFTVMFLLFVAGLALKEFLHATGMIP